MTVVCGRLEVDPEDRRQHTAINPCLIVEVLSPSTEDYDRGEKLEHYKQIASLQEVVLVAHDEPSVEVVRRVDGAWVHVTYRQGAAELPSLDSSLPLDEVYRDPLEGG